MGKVMVMSNNQELIAKKIRYFDYKNKEYFIYTLDERDQDDYVKVYISKFISDLEYTIDDIEWDDLKTIIPTIVKQIKANCITIFNDLDINKIKTVNLINSRVFKLKQNIVDIITNISIEEPEEDNYTFSTKKDTNSDENLTELEKFLINSLSLEKQEIRIIEKSEPENIQIPLNPLTIDHFGNEEEIDSLRQRLSESLKNIRELTEEKENLRIEISVYKRKIDNLKKIIKEL